MIQKVQSMEPLAVLARWSIPLTMLTSVVGGSVWLTTTANKVSQLEAEISQFRNEYQSQRDRIFDRLADQDQRLSRIEGKIDIVISELRKP